MGGGQRVVLGGVSTLRFSSLAALTPFVFLVGRPGFLLERFYRYDRHSKGTCFRTYVGECARVKRGQPRKRTNTKKTTEVLLTQRGVFVYERPVQHRNWRE